MKQENYIISREQIIKMVESALKSHRVFAPKPRKPHTFSNEKERGKQYFTFEEIKEKSGLKNIALEYDTTILPPKKIFFPANEVLFTLKNKKISEPKPAKPAKPALILGAHPADIYGLLQLGEIMTSPKPDYYYLKRKEKSVIIGISQNRHNYDFSKRWGILPGHLPPIFDIFLDKMPDGGYLATVGSPAGKKLIRKIKLKKAGEKLVAQIKAGHIAEQEPDGQAYDQDTIKKAVIASQDGKIWEELEKICLGCGICTYVCPLCYCFDVEDKTDYSTGECTRCRNWDACTLPTFAEIAGGKNFRPALKNRYFNWYFHKFVRGLEEYGQAQCVGCGRCSKFCPAGINVENVLDRIVREYK